MEDLKEKLNSYITEYKLTGCEYSFSRIYEILIERRSLKFNEIARSLRATAHEVRALYEDVLMKCIKDFNGKVDFENYYNFSIKNKRANMYRDRKTRLNYEVVNNFGKDEESAATLEPVDEETPETIYFAKKRADQRQLIDSLLEKADETTRQIVETFLGCDRPNPTAIGKRLGLHHSTVIRKLEKLAGSFDTKQHGNYRDYLVVSE
ncbi:sigma-70 family RNA polymerase sigma factor [Bacillus safensis]|uniref:sigma-70 family RNA polymerase sigma factor n=1 Tax=Bacillus safensis TaxID=561879 RepID=UPI0013C2A5ED|nr:sigma-70 family RNA polymerase sigma factor [Bacillus safensis]